MKSGWGNWGWCTFMKFDAEEEGLSSLAAHKELSRRFFN